MTDNVLLSVKDLATAHHKQRVSDGITFTLKKAQSLCILGPNGEGKTTLMKTLLGLLPALSGSIFYHGKALSTLPFKARARLFSYVPQNSAVNFSFTVMQMVLMARTSQLSLFEVFSQQMHEKAFALLQQLDIADLANKNYTKISGGQRQMVLIARALFQQSELIVLDEPTASLDFANQDKLLQLLSRLKKEGHSIIFSTHQPDQAFYFSDYALMLKDRGMMAIGETANVLTEENLKHLYQADVAIADLGGKKITYIR